LSQDFGCLWRFFLRFEGFLATLAGSTSSQWGLFDPEDWAKWFRYVNKCDFDKQVVGPLPHIGPHLTNCHISTMSLTSKGLISTRTSFLRPTPREQTSEPDYGHFEAGRFELEHAYKKLWTTTSKWAGAVELVYFTNHEGAVRLANESNSRIMNAGGYTETWD
jgi:hypothetical protein